MVGLRCAGHQIAVPRRQGDTMNNLMRFISRVAIAAGFGALLATSAAAAPPGVVNLGAKLFQFNVIAKPGGWDPSVGNFCNGARIFFAQNSGGPDNTLGTITWNIDPAVPGFEITDCNGTDGNATVTANQNISFAVVIRVQGPATSALNLVCAVVVPNGGNTLCVIGTGTFKKGHSFTTITTNVAADTFAQVLWTLSGDWKIFDVRLYQLL